MVVSVVTGGFGLVVLSRMDARLQCFGEGGLDVFGVMPGEQPVSVPVPHFLAAIVVSS